MQKKGSPFRIKKPLNSTSFSALVILTGGGGTDLGGGGGCLEDPGRKNGLVETLATKKTGNNR